MEAKPWLNQYDAAVPAAMNYPAVPVTAFLEEAARTYGKRDALVYRDQAVTFEALERLTERLAGALVRWGLRKGDVVGLLMPNCPQFVASFFAVLRAGGVAAAINPAYKARELEFQLKDSGAVMVIAQMEAYDLLQSVRAKTAVRTIALTGGEDGVRLGAWLHGTAQPPAELPALQAGDVWLGAWAAEGKTVSLPAVGPEDAAIFQYSGGTTGVPKAAVGLHRNLAANTLQFRAWLSGLQDGQETSLLAIPLYHVYGMVVGMCVSLRLGARMVLQPDPRDLNEILRLIQTYQPAFYPGVPAMYAALNQHPDVVLGKASLRSIRACISGSAPLLREVQERFEALSGAKLMEGYGLSEAPTATHCNPMFGEKRPGSIGLPLPDVDCRLVSLEDSTREVGAGEIGELALRGPQVMVGYHGMPEETAAALRDGWLFTGDIARMDADGYFYLVDRKKDLIKVGGLQVWPREVEEVLAEHPAVSEAAAAGVPHPMRGEVVKAWIVLRAGAAASAEELREWCEQRLASFKAPVEIAFRERLPRTPVGKLLRRELVREHLEAATPTA